MLGKSRAKANSSLSLNTPNKTSTTNNNTNNGAAASTSRLSNSEQDATKKLFNLICTQCPRLLHTFEKLIAPDSHKELCQSMISLAQTTGNTFNMIRNFIEEEFKRNGTKEQGSIMRGNCMASRLTKEYLQRVGDQYLRQTIVPFLQQLIEADKSMEIDPNKIEPGKIPVDDVIAANKHLLNEAAKSLVATITSQQSVDKMPIEVKVIACYFGEFANNYASDQFYALVGGFLLLRWINPAVSNPDVYGLIPENRLTPNTRRNLVLLTKVMQNLSNGVEFSMKEPYMICMNEFIKANFWKMEKYFRAIVSPINAPKIVEPNIPESDYLLIHKIFTDFSGKILESYDSGKPKTPVDPVRQNIQELLDTFGQYRHIDNFLRTKFSNDEQPITIRMVIETHEQNYEAVVDGNPHFLQPLVQKIITKINKHDQKALRTAIKQNSRKDIKVESSTSVRKGNSANLVNSTTIFGRSLDEYMEQQSKYRIDLKIPEFLTEALKAIWKRGLGVEAIFRIPGDPTIVEQLKKDIDKGERVTFAKVENISNVCSIVKLYLKELPDAIFTEDSTQAMIDLGTAALSVDQSKGASKMFFLEKVKNFLSTMPKHHYDLLEALMSLLWNIDRNSSTNLMNSHNLSLVFGVPLLHRGKLFHQQNSQKSETRTSFASISKKNSVAQMLSDTPALNDSSSTSINKIIETIIKEYEYLFQDSIMEAEREAKKGVPLLRYRIIAHNKSVNSIIYVRCGPQPYAITTSGWTIRLWDAENGNLIKELDNGAEYGSIMCSRAETDAVTNVTNGRIWCTTDKATSVWDIESGELVHAILRGATTVTQYKGEMWINSFTEPTVYVYDIQTFECISSFSVLADNVLQMYTFGDLVWAGSGMGTITVWDAKEKVLVKEIKSMHTRKINSFAEVESTVWTGGDDGSICVWNKKTYEMEKRLESHSGKVKHLVYANGNVWCSTWDMSIRVYTQNYELVAEVKEHNDAVSGVVFHYNTARKKWYLWSASYDASICVFMIP